VAASLLLTTLLMLAACSSSNRGVTGSVGVGTGVALITANDTTQLTVGQTLSITAAVTNDVNNEGVTWSIQQGTTLPQGALSEQTSTSVLFSAPTTSFAGETSATITATSKANPTYYSQVTIVTLGTEQFNTATLFPANVNVAYAASLSVTGGTQPFAWTLASGSDPLPPGLTLNGSTSGLDSISGTPTQAGKYTFTIQAEDATSVPIKQTVTLVVNPQATCILPPGSYALMVSGFRGGGGMTHVANITVDAAGVISGEQDYKDGHLTTTDEQLDATTSLCTNRQTNSGQIALNAASANLLYNMSVTPPDANGVIQSARVQLIGSGSDSASGLLQRVDSSTLGTGPPAGNFAFGLLGLSKQEPSSVHFASAGRFTSDASGTLTAGSIDSNAAPALTNSPLSGTLSAPDALGRGTASLSYGGQSALFVYYFVTPDKYYLMNIDPQNAAANTPRSSGFMTMQVGNVAAASFDNNAFGSSSAPSASVLSLWGAIVGRDPITVQTMGLLSGSVPAAGGGTLNGLLDISNQSTDLVAQVFSDQLFGVDTSGTGRGTLTLSNNLSSYTLVFYLDGIGNGYLVQQNDPSGAGSGGLLEAQATMPAGGFPVTLPGFFVGGTQFAMSAGPITLNPLATLSFGTLSSNFTNALFFIDQTTGRGLGTLTQTGVGTQPAALYYVSPTKLDVLRFSTRAFDGNIDWLIQN
jgi:hypothetical protein